MTQVEVPAELQRDLKAAMEKAGIPVPESEERWGKAMDALKVCTACAEHATSRSHPIPIERRTAQGVWAIKSRTLKCALP